MTDHPDIDELFADDPDDGSAEETSDEAGTTDASSDDGGDDGDDGQDWTTAFADADLGAAATTTEADELATDGSATAIESGDDGDDGLGELDPWTAADESETIDDTGTADDDSDDDIDTETENGVPDVDDDVDLLALADEAAARYEPTAEPEPQQEDEPEPSASPVAAAVATNPDGAARPRADARRPVPAPTAPPAAGGDGLLLQFPSEDFPPPPVFRIRVPEDWLAIPVPDALMAVRQPDDLDGFHPNVLVRCRRTVAARAPGDDLRLLASLDDVPTGMELLGDEVKAEGPTPARWVQVRFEGPGGTVLQARHLLVYVPATANVANILSVVGTWPDAAAPEVAAQVQRIVGSLRLFLPTGTTA